VKRAGGHRYLSFSYCWSMVTRALEHDRSTVLQVFSRQALAQSGRMATGALLQ